MCLRSRRWNHHCQACNGVHGGRLSPSSSLLPHRIQQNNVFHCGGGKIANRSMNFVPPRLQHTVRASRSRARQLAIFSSAESASTRRVRVDKTVFFILNSRNNPRHIRSSKNDRQDTQVQLGVRVCGIGGQLVATGNLRLAVGKDLLCTPAYGGLGAVAEK